MATRVRRRDASGHVDPFHQRRRRYEAALRPLGLWESFARMPRRMQELFWQFKSPDPLLVFESGFPGGPEHRPLRRELERRFREAAIEINGAPVSVRDVVGVLIGLLSLVRHIKGQDMPQEVARFAEVAGPRLEQCRADHLGEALAELYRAVEIPLMAHSRLDVRLLAPRLEVERTERGKPATRVILSAVEPQVRRVMLEGEPRPMYRAGTVAPESIRWLSWSRRQLRESGARQWRQAPEELPVFVQSHALLQLRRRVNLPAAAPYVEAWLAEALTNPKIVRRLKRDDLLVEYRIGDHRVGYLVVTPLPDLVAVRTFLFLTMEPAPEARRLERQLRLTRRDVDWLGLHELSAFTQTDLHADPVLRPLLESCGCGQLFALNDAGADDCAPAPRPFAAEVRRYLRMAA